MCRDCDQSRLEDVNWRSFRIGDDFAFFTHGHRENMWYTYEDSCPHEGTSRDILDLQFNPCPPFADEAIVRSCHACFMDYLDWISSRNIWSSEQWYISFKGERTRSNGKVGSIEEAYELIGSVKQMDKFYDQIDAILKRKASVYTLKVEMSAHPRFIANECQTWN